MGEGARRGRSPFGAALSAPLAWSIPPALTTKRDRRAEASDAWARTYITRSRRGLGVTPGVRPRLAIGLPSISWMSAVKSFGEALEM